MAEYAVQLTDVNKTIGKKKIIKNLSFTIQPGEVFGFIGPNGAGKTTTIRMMVGLMKITSGDIRILGKSIKSDYKQAIREVGVIVENPEMYPFMTGIQNLKHFARMTPGVTKERINQVIKLVGLEKVINQKTGKYSLGMRQRLGIAHALLHNPSVLILDEPTNGLDPAGIREIRSYIRDLAEKENVAVIISSHLLSEIELMCDRIGVIKNGELVTTQSVHESGDTTDSEIPVQMEVSPIDKAKELIQSTYELDVTITDGVLQVKVDKETIPALIKTLATNDIRIYQVNAAKTTLEDKFFNLIGENTIA